MSRALLELENVVVGWHTPVLGPFSLSLQAGEVVGIGGANGTGKSTLLASIAGQASVFSGNLRRAPGTTVAWQTQHQPPIHGIPINGQEWLDVTGSSPAGLPDWLADKLSFRLDVLSGGQSQYLALWAVLNSPASIILLDEPSNSLDQAGCQHLSEAIRQRAARGAGIILVSHESSLLTASCDRCLNIKGEENRV